MTTLKAPYFEPRLRKDGETLCRFTASPKLRKLGFVTFDYYTDGPPLEPHEAQELGFAPSTTQNLPFTHPGRLMSVGEAVAAAHIVAKMIEHQLDNPQDETDIRLHAQAKPMNIDHLLDDYFETEEFNNLAPKTQLGYKSWAVLIRKYFGDQRPKALDEISIIETYWAARNSRGERLAYGAVQILRIVYKWGRSRSRKWKHHAPGIEWSGLKIPTPKPRVRVGTDEELDAIMLAAENPLKIHQLTGAKINEKRPSELLPRPSLADALMIALWTAQRQTDILLLTSPNLSRGRCALQQSKGGKFVSVPLMDPLKQRIAELKRRKMQRGWGDRPQIILTDVNGIPYQTKAATNTTFSSYFCRVRNLAAEICPSVADFQFRDLRDTALTRLGAAGCDIWEIISWSGHNPDTAMQVIKHYMAIDQSFADRAGEKLAKHLAKGH
ncbi:MAG: hypothetical protein COA69_13605 [Robiginitomaculum sp.]|nr:MAG: hypothetical protein COA69_13605 [Robiginitomaculum sp.]